MKSFITGIGRLGAVVATIAVGGCGQTASTDDLSASSGGRESGGAEAWASGGSEITGSGGSTARGGGCSGAYESLPVETAARSLPTVLEAELCNARDSRVWAIEVIAARAIVVTLENPSAIEHFDLGVYANLPGYEPLVVSAGETRISLGSEEQTTLRFTPQEAGTAAFSAGLGFTHGQALRLRVEQE